MRLTMDELAREAAATGYRVEVLEKVLRLLELLDTLRSHPFLRPRLALKGGTALNLFVFDVPRLSVDVDLNYVGAADRETMLEERPKVETAIQSVCGRLGIQVKRIPSEHAGGKWRATYESASGRSGALELDVNFMLRTPLWPIVRVDSQRLGTSLAADVPILDRRELAAGKLAALLARSAGRDLFDARELLGVVGGDDLRVAFVAYGGMNRRDWRTVGIEDVSADPDEVDRQLVPMLRADLAPERAELAAWVERLVGECRDRLAAVLPLRSHEREFLDRLNEAGEIVPEVITGDPQLQRVVREHPALRWKSIHVRRLRGAE